MWLSKSIALRQSAAREGAAADMGTTTIGGGSASVMTRGEQRDLSVFSPSGVIWQPKAGDTVLVIKGGAGGQEQCIIAADTAGAAPEDLVPGELYLHSSRDTFIFLRADGSIAVKGNLSAEGDGTIKGSINLTGDVELTGAVTVNGTLSVNGNLIINGQPYRPCSCV
ncbi:MAG: polymer-forming cytoskeletal protein [Oscillospiraceae bacterium]|jgi:phage gp45-like|nr:polymer-forming cytoskeletal protein [Oscillospiraceae bacterium]